MLSVDCPWSSGIFHRCIRQFCPLFNPLDIALVWSCSYFLCSTHTYWPSAQSKTSWSKPLSHKYFTYFFFKCFKACWCCSCYVVIAALAFAITVPSIVVEMIPVGKWRMFFVNLIVSVCPCSNSNLVKFPLKW